MFSKIKSSIAYILRPELENRTRIVNLVISVIIFSLVPICIVSAILGEIQVAVMLQFALLVFSISCLWAINRFPMSEFPTILYISVVSYIFFPILFFGTGGKSTGIILWMLLGAVFSWFAVEGGKKFVFVILDYICVFLCIWCEAGHPEWIMEFSNPYAEGINMIFSFVCVSAVSGITISEQLRNTRSQKDKLSEQEKALRKSNEELAEININLQQASDAKSIFLANMSHEIRTPINAILGMDEMIIRESNNDTILSYANDIDSAGHQLLSIINDILDFSKIESGKMEIHPVEYEMFSILNDCYNMIYHRAKKKQLKLIMENNPDIPAVLFGDEVRVRQIIMNLLTNAVKYTKDGYVKVSFAFNTIDAENIELIISVKDTGIGISEENQAVMFDAFQRVDMITNRTVEGTGLGLAITKHFIELMNGRISVESKLGEGSTFTVAIPQRIANHGEVMGDFCEKFKHKEYFEDVTSKDDVEKLVNKGQSSSEGFAPMLGEEKASGASKLLTPKSEKNTARFKAPYGRVLVVDDVKMNLNVVRLLLKNTELQVDLAGSGEECLKYTMMKHYDVILMDHMMPGMDGIETLHKLKEQQMGLNPNTPVVVLTANAIQSVEEKYLQEGFVSYLSKPVKGDKLEDTLLKYLPEAKVQMTE